uniref:cDNA FLJ40118 fis, clone TESTI2009412 n=1 Tax=Homo sapiens TaxID=9606 RepID=Q8N822_HUMAN|nr:unnamed protein product [Homo sapiens]
MGVWLTPLCESLCLLLPGLPQPFSFLSSLLALWLNEDLLEDFWAILSPLVLWRLSPVLRRWELLPRALSFSLLSLPSLQPSALAWVRSLPCCPLRLLLLCRVETGGPAAASMSASAAVLLVSTTPAMARLTLPSRERLMDALETCSEDLPAAPATATFVLFGAMLAVPARAMLPLFPPAPMVAAPAMAALTCPGAELAAATLKAPATVPVAAPAAAPAAAASLIPPVAGSSASSVDVLGMDALSTLVGLLKSFWSPSPPA